MANRRIDVHTHAMSQEVAMALAARGFQPTGGYKISVAWTPEGALAYMDRQEIAAQVVSMPMAFAGFDDDPQFGTRVCRMINEGNAELIAKHPVGSVPSPACPPTAPSKRWPNWPTPWTNWALTV